MANSIIDDTTAIAKRLREITGETTKAKVVKIDCIHCCDVGWVRSGPSSRWHAGLGNTTRGPTTGNDAARSIFTTKACLHSKERPANRPPAVWGPDPRRAAQKAISGQRSVDSFRACAEAQTGPTLRPVFRAAWS